ncbi:hypothetical protein CDAR_367061 [Caerostris darwini]|uniref:PilZ domain-containing protein n=1 Tax=Caerostris darwini TaxID=1538125 RepID=A0AAV4WLT9_9ARAC|nr:hypothetical protein CDAR_367061 [Caerostris darwini]
MTFPHRGRGHSHTEDNPSLRPQTGGGARKPNTQQSQTEYKKSYADRQSAEVTNHPLPQDIPSPKRQRFQLTFTNTLSVVRIHGELSRLFEIVNGARQGLLFTVTLEKVIGDAGINTRGTIFNKSVQILAYADGRDIIARSESTLIESFLALERQG